MDESAFDWLQADWDIDGDGSFTFADAGSWFTQILLFPGDGLIYLLLTYAPPVARTAGIDRGDYGSALSACFAIVAWVVALVAVGTLITLVRELDRRATAWLARRYRNTIAWLRALRRRLVSMLHLLTRKGRTRDDGLTVDMVTLASLETAVLRCLSNADDGAVMTLDEIAGKVARRRREVIPVLRRLMDLDLVEPAADRYVDKKGHRIATAGQIYLLGS